MTPQPADAAALPQRASAQATLPPRANFMLDALPRDLQRSVADRLRGSDRHAWVQLSKSSAGMHRAIQDGSDRRTELRLQTLLVEAVERLVNELPLATIGLCQEAGHLLQQMAAPYRRHLVDRAVGFNFMFERSQIIQALGNGLGALEPSQRAALVEAALAIADDYLRGGAISALCKGMAHLNDVQQAQLLSGAFDLPPGRFETLQTVHANVAHVNDPALRARVIDTVIEAGAIGGLPKAMAQLNSDQRERLLNNVFVGWPGQVAERVAAFSVGLAHLNEPQRARLADAVLAFARDYEKAAAMAGLGPQLAYFNRDQRQWLLDMPDTCPQPATKGRLIESFGGALAALEPAQRSRLVETALALPDSPDFLLQSPRTVAIGGLGNGLAHVTEVEREHLVNAALAGNPACRHVALRGLAGGIATLSDVARRKLFDACEAYPVGLFSSHDTPLFWLCNAFADLTQSEQERLLPKVQQFASPPHRVEALSRMVISAGEASSQ